MCIRVRPEHNRSRSWIHSSFSKIPSMHAWGPEFDLQHPHKIRVWWLEPLTLVLRPETGGSLEPVGLLTSEAA